MILGIGTDIVEIERIDQSLKKSHALARRVLTDNEYAEFEISLHPSRYLAKKFASKEATVKAIGTGIGYGMSWQHIEISHDEKGKPLLIAHGAFDIWCKENGVNAMHISIADEQDYASAFVVIEASK
uniref:holo-ACP synthase n=1 Tax=Ningiella ruwaisensis TaxID=2364274 RepID=UPI00109FF243|nr:holo-ACP synthase [Ningiella ruwaisensis]